MCFCVGSFFSRRPNPRSAPTPIPNPPKAGLSDPQSRDAVACESRGNGGGTDDNEPDLSYQQQQEQTQPPPGKRFKKAADDLEGQEQEFGGGGAARDNNRPSPQAYRYCKQQQEDEEEQKLLTESPDEKCWNDIVAGRLQVPMPVYVLGPNDSAELSHFKPEGLREGYELAENVLYLGQQGLFQTQEGLTVAYISGREELLKLNQEQRKDLLRQAQSDKKGFRGVDILLTSQWPKGVLRPCFHDDEKTQDLGAPEISTMVLSLKPRYHFAALHGHFVERPPYHYHSRSVLSNGPKCVTRFIALAKVCNPEKKKWIYAFQLVPISRVKIDALNQHPADATDLPYERSDLIVETGDQEPPRWDSLRFGTRKELRSFKNQGRDVDIFNRRSQNKSHQTVPRGPCWFCLAGTEVEKHLIVSVGDFSYLAMPKGALSSNHVLILPIGHFPSSLDIPDEVKNEMDQFKKSLLATAKSHGQDILFFERNFKSQHLQIQAVFVPSLKLEEFDRILTSTCKPYKIDLVSLADGASLSEVFEPGNLYFAIEFNGRQVRYCSIEASTFPLQLGREIAANILQCPNKVNWKDCALEQNEESRLVLKFRSTFSDHDFTLK